MNNSVNFNNSAKEVKPMTKEKFDYTGCPTYVVKDGDTLYTIAQKYPVALEQLRYFNHVNKATRRIRPGQVLHIPVKPVYVPVGE